MPPADRTRLVRAQSGGRPQGGMRVVITAVTDDADDKSIATVTELDPDVVTKQ